MATITTAISAEGRVRNMRTYRKKPVVIEAVQWTGLNLEEIKSFVGRNLQYDIIDTA